MTLLERLTHHRTAEEPWGLGLDEERARAHLRGSFVRVDGEVVDDPNAEVTALSRLTLQPPPITEHEGE